MVKFDFRNKVRIAVIGGANPDEQSWKEARRVGELIAEKGGILVCGGLSGVMEAAAQGAKSKGGLTMGILPGYSSQEANPYIDLPIATGLGPLRNSLVVLNLTPGRFPEWTSPAPQKKRFL